MGMQGVEMCKDRPHEHAAKPHKPLLKLCCFQSSCSVLSLFTGGVHQHHTLQQAWLGHAMLPTYCSPFPTCTAPVQCTMHPPTPRAALSMHWHLERSRMEWASAVVSSACDRRRQKSYLENVRILQVGWFDEKCYFHTNGTLEKHELNFL